LDDEWNTEEANVDDQKPHVIEVGVLVKLGIDDPHQNWMVLYIFGELAVDQYHDVLDGSRLVIRHLSHVFLLSLDLLNQVDCV
jgi:hypothetical protein